jgi:hypothetical protein
MAFFFLCFTTPRSVVENCERFGSTYVSGLSSVLRKVFQNMPSLRTSVLHTNCNRKDLCSPVNSTVRPLNSRTDPSNKRFQTSCYKMSTHCHWKGKICLLLKTCNKRILRPKHVDILNSACTVLLVLFMYLHNT